MSHDKNYIHVSRSTATDFSMKQENVVKMLENDVYIHRQISLTGVLSVTNKCISVYVRTYVYVYVCVCKCMYMCRPKCMYVYVCMYTVSRKRPHSTLASNISKG